MTNKCQQVQTVLAKEFDASTRAERALVLEHMSKNFCPACQAFLDQLKAKEVVKRGYPVGPLEKLCIEAKVDQVYEQDAQDPEFLRVVSKEKP